MEYSDAVIVKLQERRWMSPRRKELGLTLDLPAPKHSRYGCPEVRFLCDYKLTGETERYGGRLYHEVLGTWGPFAEVYKLALEPDPKPPNAEPWVIATLDGKKDTKMWLGLWSGLDLRLTREEMIADVEPPRYVHIEYSTTKYGNIFHTNIRADVLEELLKKEGLDWVITPRIGRGGRGSMADVKVRNPKPYLERSKVYPNAQREGLWGAIAVWCDDDWADAKEIFLGSDFPSKGAAEEAVRNYRGK
jgi:hypothetical protein